ncbi:MAG: hypothetical protein ABSB68_16690 [Acidimicrobiales bacterium]|jgi:hypothetical protein
MADSDPSETQEHDRQGERPDHTIDDEHGRRDRHIDEQEEESFPASDPHADWSGPPD